MSKKRFQPGPVLGYYKGIPIAPVTVEEGEQNHLLRLAACPLCGRPHVHGGGRLGKDPRHFQGHRTSHCPMRIPNDRGYILRIVDGQDAVVR
jgi:hypothetical protein